MKIDFQAEHEKRIDERGGLELDRHGIARWMYGELKVDMWWVATIANEYERARGKLEKNGKAAGYTPGKNIRMLWEDPALDLPAPVEVKFQPVADKCTVTVTIERLQTRPEADGYRKAWGGALVRLKELLES